MQINRFSFSYTCVCFCLPVCVGLGNPPHATGRTNDVAAQHSCRAAAQTWQPSSRPVVLFPEKKTSRKKRKDGTTSQKCRRFRRSPSARLDA